MKRHTIRLKVNELMDAASEKDYINDTELAAAIGVSVTQVWRAKLPVDDERHNSPGTAFIAGVLAVFGGPFEKFFFLDSMLRPCNK